MPSPFPGMDPYLEDPDVWPDFQHHLATFITVDLNNSLPEAYYARVEKRSELGVVLGKAGARHIVPDVIVIRQPLQQPQIAIPVVNIPRTQIIEPVRFLAHSEPLSHHFVEIRDARHNHELVTLIEIVSPSNKGLGPDRQAYERKQRETLNSRSNLIELDLLREGERVLTQPEVAAAVTELGGDYLVFINRADGDGGTRAEYELYPIRLVEVLPCIPVPLRPGEADVPLDLQIVVNRAYDGGMYRRLIDYRQPPHPPLTDEQAAWSAQALRAAGLR